MNREEPSDDIIARVNDQYLTASEVDAWEATLRQVSVPTETRLAYIRHWVEEELVYQDALKRNLLNDAWVAESLEKFKRKLLISRYYEKDAGNIVQPSSSSVRAYFQEHSAEYVWEQLHIEVEYWRSDGKDGMNKLRADLLRGNLDAIWTGRPGSLDRSRLALDGSTSADPVVWKVISRLKTGEVSNVITLNGSFWIFKLISRFQAGEPKSIEDVQDEIVSRLMEEALRLRREELIRHLVEKYRENGSLQWTDASLTVSIVDTTKYHSKDK